MVLQTIVEKMDLNYGLIVLNVLCVSGITSFHVLVQNICIDFTNRIILIIIF